MALPQVWPTPPTTLCRICLRPDPVGQWSLFECSIMGRSIAEVLSEVGGILLPAPRDAFPHQVCCSSCLQQLEVALNLRELIRESDRKLGEMLGSQRVVKQEQEDPTVVSISSRPSIVGGYEIVKVEGQPLDSGSTSSTNIKSEPLMESQDDKEVPLAEDPTNTVKSEPTDDYDDDPTDEEEMPIEEVHIKEEFTVEEPQLQDLEQPVAKRKKFGKHTIEFLVHFEEVMVQPTECCGCRVVFNGVEELEEHIEKEHVTKRLVEFEKGWHECFRCFMPIQSDKKHRLRSLRCKVCGEECSTYFSATSHYRDCHGPESDSEQKSCCGCMKKFKTIEELKLHSNEVHLPNRLPHDSARPFVCEICYKNYPNYRGLHRHQTRLQQIKPNQCSQCERSFFYLNALKDHELSHTKEKSFPCPECPKTFTNAEALRKHRTRHVIPADKFQCQTCQKSFKSLKSLREHTYFHTGERPHKCPHCEASFSRIDCYTMHIRTKHAPEAAKVHRCKVCQNTFGTEKYLVRHERSHEKSPHPCAYCERGFSRKEYLKKHVEKMHPGVGGLKD